jgi:hypothetical protein
MLSNILIGTDSLPLGAPTPGVTEVFPTPGGAVDELLDNPDATVSQLVDAVAVDELMAFAKEHPMPE